MSELHKKIKKIKALKNIDGMQYLLNYGYEILGKPIYVHDLDYKFLACTENIVTDDPLWNELITCGTHGDETIEFFRDEYFIDAVANAKLVAFLISDKLKYDRLFGKILNRDNIMVAYAYLLACNKSFESDDPIIFEIFCKKLSAEVSKSDFYQTYGEMHQEAVINELINGHIKDKRLYTSRVAEICNGLRNYLYIAIADFAESNNQNRLIDLKTIFKQTEPMFKYAINFNNIIMIISSDNEEFDVKKDLKKLKKFIEEKNIRIGISKCFENPFESHIHYIEAFKALQNGINYNSDQRIFLSQNVPLS